MVLLNGLDAGESCGADDKLPCYRSDLPKFMVSVTANIERNRDRAGVAHRLIRLDVAQDVDVINRPLEARILVGEPLRLLND